MDTRRRPPFLTALLPFHRSSPATDIQVSWLGCPLGPSPVSAPLPRVDGAPASPSFPYPWLSPSLSLLGASAHHPWVLDLTGPVSFQSRPPGPTFPYKILTAQTEGQGEWAAGPGERGSGRAGWGMRGLRGCTS